MSWNVLKGRRPSRKEQDRLSAGAAAGRDLATSPLPGPGIGRAAMGGTAGRCREWAEVRVDRHAHGPQPIRRRRTRVRVLRAPLIKLGQRGDIPRVLAPRSLSVGMAGRTAIEGEHPYAAVSPKSKPMF